ncbi:S8 family serine peptidase [Arenimonas sp.]|uniref:S8 family serine peptidase n=1 Tax=Arenimonas sp. TaxID=1872635 RepID=UPI0035B3B0D5
MRASPLMLAIALGIGLPQASMHAAARQLPLAETKVGESSRWIVVFEEAPAGNFRGFDPADRLRPKLAASHHSIRGGERYDSRSPEARAYIDYLGDLRKMRLADYSARLGRPLEPIYTYVHATNGVALELDAEEAALLRTMPGVASVSPDFKRRLQTDYGPGWINADEIWSGAATGSPHRGEGIVVGVIDSGINRSHVAFSGAGHANPLGGYRGYCTTVPSACNAKLIGLWDFTVGNNGLAPGADTDGHGTHVAATAAGAEFAGMSGVAPRANIISYKACPDDGDGCNGTALVRSIDQAVADGVDVINYSIGGDNRDPWAYNDSDAFLNARDAGVVASVAAGNDGPDFGSLNSPSNSPWVFSVAAASHDRNGPNSADILAGFSGRGGVIPFSVLKPDLTAPGVQIVSASNVGTMNTALKSGTSMATPHVAGAVALLKSVNPSLGADQLMSALQLTARPSVRRATILDLADPHHQGSGMVDVAKATQAGLFLPVAAGSFATARSSVFTGGAQNLNLPSLAHGGCFIGCSLSRTFRAMPGAAGTTYSVQASLAAGATITPSVSSFTASNTGTAVNFSVSVQDADLIGDWVYGEVRLVNTSGNGRPDLRLPVAIYFSPSSNEAGIPAEITINAAHERGFHDVSFGDLVPMPNARFVASQLTAPVVQTRNIPVDPTNDDAFDDVQQNYVETFQIPAGEGIVHRIRISTQAAVPDIDLFVGRDSNNNGLPSKGEIRCESRSPESAELCDFTVAGSSSVQTFWMMVQNWTGPGSNVRISRAVASSADGDGQALLATGPGHLDTNEDFSVRLGYDDPSMGPAQERLGFLKLQPSPGATAVEIPVRITRTGATPSPFALAPGQARKVWLEPGAAHERLVFDVPANATAVSFQTQGAGSVSLYAAHVPNPTGPVIQPAPARGAPGVLSATGPGGNKTLAVSGANLQPGRWYVTPVNTGAAATSVDVSAVITTSTGSLKVKGGSYYPPARGGHGLFMYPAGAAQVVIWYTFLQDGTPTWYYMQAPQPGSNGSWTTPIYRAAWNGTANHLVEVGEAVMSATSDSQFSFAYNLDGFTGVESMDAFLVGCPSIGGAPVDASGNWFDPVRAGSGYSVQLNPNYEFFAAFIYDDLGLPRFLLAERSGAFNAGANTLQLDQLQGFAPLGAHSTPVRSPVGTLGRQFTGNALAGISVNATFANGVAGTWNVNDAVVPLGNTQGCP